MALHSPKRSTLQRSCLNRLQLSPSRCINCANRFFRAPFKHHRHRVLLEDVTRHTVVGRFVPENPSTPSPGAHAAVDVIPAPPLLYLSLSMTSIVIHVEYHSKSFGFTPPSGDCGQEMKRDSGEPSCLAVNHQPGSGSWRKEVDCGNGPGTFLKED